MAGGNFRRNQRRKHDRNTNLHNRTTDRLLDRGDGMKLICSYHCGNDHCKYSTYAVPIDGTPVQLVDMHESKECPDYDNGTEERQERKSGNV